MYFLLAPFEFAKGDGLIMSLRWASIVKLPTSHTPTHTAPTTKRAKISRRSSSIAHSGLTYVFHSVFICYKSLLIFMNCASTTSWRVIQHSWRFWQWAGFAIQSLAQWEGSSG